MGLYRKKWLQNLKCKMSGQNQRPSERWKKEMNVTQQNKNPLFQL